MRSPGSDARHPTLTVSAHLPEGARDLATGAALACGFFVLFLALPVVQITDHKYLLMAAESLATRGTLRMDGLAIDGAVLDPGDGARSPDYRIEVARGHYYHLFPVGTALAMAPLTGLARLVGVSSIDPAGHYDARAERRSNRVLAALLTAVLAVPMFAIARTQLAALPSAALVTVGMLGSQLTSTASRGLWSHDGALVCTALVLWQLVRLEVGGTRPNGVVLGSLLAWAYLFRPTAALSVVACVAVLAAGPRPGALLGSTMAGLALWLMPFVAWSMATRGTLVPPYYAAGRLSLAGLGTGLMGDLVSPSRGTLIYVPWLPWLAWAAWRARRRLVAPRLVLAAAAVTLAHLAMVGSFPQWYGGHCFGARMTTELMPWWFVVAVGVAPAIHGFGRRSASTWLAGGLVVLAIVLNGIGAASEASWRWNSRHGGIDAHPERLWSVRDAQFLAPVRDQPDDRP